MVQQMTDTFWQAEARSEDTKKFIKDIKRITRHKFSIEEKIRIVLEGFRRDTPIRDLCRREGIHPGIYSKWSKAFLEAGKQRLTADPVREAGSEEVSELRAENEDLKQVVAEQTLRIRKLKKTLKGLE